MVSKMLLNVFKNRRHNSPEEDEHTPLVPPQTEDPLEIKHISISSPIDPCLLSQITSIDTLMSVHVMCMSQDEMTVVVEAIARNESIVKLDFQNCAFSPEAKNQITAIFNRRTIKKFGVENCGLDDFDQMWLEYLLRQSYAAESITLVESFSEETCERLFEALPIANLRSLRLSLGHLHLLQKKPCLGSYLKMLDIKQKLPMTSVQVEQLFSIIASSKISELKLSTFSVIDFQTFIKLMDHLQKSTQVLKISIRHIEKMEQHFCRMLAMYNYTLESISIERCGVEMDQHQLTRIQDFTTRNRALNRANAYLFSFSMLDFTQDPESVQRECNILISDLQAVNDPHYVSICQQQIPPTISMLEVMKAHVQAEAGQTLRF